MTSPGLQLEKLTGSHDHKSLLGLKGHLTVETVPNFIQTVKQESAAHLILEMGGVSFLDSAGVGALVQVFVHRRNKGQTLALAGLTKQGSAIIQVAGLRKLLPTYASVDEALAGGSQ